MQLVIPVVQASPSPLASFTFGAPFDAPSSQNIVVQVLRPACDTVIELHSIKCI
jgi:hypothetical protein